MAAVNEALKTEATEIYTFFYGSKEVFSQFYPCKFTVDDVQYNCAEQYMMHQKAVVFKDGAMADAIMKSHEPRKMKSYGRKVQNFDAKKWDSLSIDVVKTGSYAKFTQDEELLKAMLDTTGTVLVEASPRDRLWGIGMGRNNPNAKDRKKWRGQNRLGFCLTDVRDRIIKEKRDNEIEKSKGNSPPLKKLRTDSS